MPTGPLEQALRLVVAAAADAMLLVGADGLIQASNAAASRLFRLAPGELEGAGVEDLVPPSQRELHRGLRQRSAVGRRLGSGFAVQARRGDGTLFQAEVGLSPLGDGRVLATVVDITDRERIAAALSERESLLRLFIEYAPAALAMFDREMTYLAASQRWIADHGLRGRQVHGASHYEVFPDQPARWRDVHQRGLAGEVLSANEDRFDRPDGSVQWLKWEVRPWHAAPDRVGGIVIYTEDITERKRDEQERERARAHVSRQRSRMERLLSRQVASHTVSAIAHDLNQPLSAVAAYCEAALQMMQSGHADPERLMHAVRSGAEQAHRAGKVLRELLDYLRKGDMRTERVALDAVVEMALSIVRDDGEGEFRTTIDAPATGAAVRANRQLLEKVLVNLLRNSLEAMREGAVAAPALRLSWRDAGHGMAEVTVADNGPGLDPAVARRAFDPFFSTKADGVGMGLAISRSIVESLGGTMWLGSPAEGAQVHFTLPLCQ